MRRVVIGLAILLVALSGSPLLAAAPLPGAIFTTNDKCDGVDLNIYTSKDAVYLDGGPAHPAAAGLPDGSYFVQVTEPEGAVLGRTRTTAVVTVVNGTFLSCYQLSAIVDSPTTGLPGYDDTSNPGGEYKVWVSTDPSFPNNASKTDNFKVKVDCTKYPDDSTCTNPPQKATIVADKFYDANANGQYDSGDIEIPGWKICVQEAAGINDCNHVTPMVMTVTPDTYTVSEGTPVQSNWVHTTPTSDTFTVADGDTHTSTFGNVCLGPGGGLTLGFWSNKNGQAVMNGGIGGMTGALAFLTSLNLRNADGSTFDPTSYSAFRNWILGATATNMANMLSAQLAAMELNVRSGFVNGGSLVYAPCLIGSGSNPLGFISIGDLMAAANTSLGANGHTVSADSDRTLQECLKTALDKANNNLNFVQAAPCPFSF